MEKIDQDQPKTSSMDKAEEMLESSTTDMTSEDEQTARQPKKPLIEQLQAQLRRNQKKRFQTRDYVRILGESQVPAQWYKAPVKTHSVYLYDPHYQTNSPSKFAQYPRLAHSRVGRKPLADQVLPVILTCF